MQLNVEEMRWHFLRITIPYVMLVTEYQKVFTLIEKHLTSVLAFNDMTCIWDGRPVRFARASRPAHDRTRNLQMPVYGPMRHELTHLFTHAHKISMHFEGYNWRPNKK